MNIFERPNRSNNWKCPVCNTNKDGKVFLASMVDTETEPGSHIFEAKQIHVDCLDLWISEKPKFIGMKY